MLGSSLGEISKQASKQCAYGREFGTKFPPGCAQAVSMSDAKATLPATPPPGAAADWTIPQAWSDYTPAEHAMWDRLFERQSAMLPGRVVPAFLDGLDVLRMSKP